MSTFGARLKQARQLAGLSQRQLGILAGIAPGSSSARMNQYERETHEPPATLVRKLARVLGVPTPFFYAEKNEHAELLLAFAKLPAAQRRKILTEVRKAAVNTAAKQEA
ncbi:MAG TPA: helix-turn-helix transcriptional regulator [Burkholderiaceae bacterium]